MSTKSCKPDEAIKIYQNALEQNTADVGLISKIAKALIATHDYGKVDIIIIILLMNRQVATTKQLSKTTLRTLRLEVILLSCMLN